MKKLLIYLLAANLFGTQILFANEGEKLCSAYQLQLLSVKKTYKEIEDLRRLKIIVDDIQSKISNDENAREIELLAEELELQAIAESGAEVKSYGLVSVSLAATVTATLILTKTYKSDFKNAKFLALIKDLKGWEKFKSVHAPLKRKFLYTTAVLALAGVVNYTIEAISHGNEEKRLSLLLEKVKKLLKVANDLAPLKERADSELVKLEIIKDELKELNITCNEVLE